MKWPLGKKFDLWVDAAPSDILEPLKDRQNGSFKSWDYIDPPEASVLGNIIILPGTREARQVIATVVQHENGARICGRYGHILFQLNSFMCFVLFAMFIMAISMLGDRGPDIKDWLWPVGFMASIIIYDRITRPFAKTRYDDFVGYLVRISRDGAVHPLEGRSVASAVQQSESD